MYNASYPPGKHTYSDQGPQLGEGGGLVGNCVGVNYSDRIYRVQHDNILFQLCLIVIQITFLFFKQSIMILHLIYHNNNYILFKKVLCTKENLSRRNMQDVSRPKVHLSMFDWDDSPQPLSNSKEDQYYTGDTYK